MKGCSIFARFGADSPARLAEPIEIRTGTQPDELDRSFRMHIEYAL
jgi:hypothetical protein